MPTLRTISMLDAHVRLLTLLIVAVLLACSSSTDTRSDPIVSTIVVTVASSQLVVGEHTRATAEARTADGTVIVGQQLSWSTTDPLVAQVAQDGTVTATLAGAATIVAASQGVSGSVGVTVTSASPPPATQLAIITQPSSVATSGAALTPQPAVQLRDAAGAAVPQSGVAVTASIATGTSGSLSGATAVTNTNGAATFSNLTIIGSGAYSLRFSATGLTSVASSTVTVSSSGAGSATRLGITTQPGGIATSGAALVPQPTLQLQDAGGNAVSQAGVSVTAAIASGSGALSGTTTIPTNANGAASFPNLAITGSGAHTLRFTATGLSGVTSSTISVTSGGGTSTTLIAENFEDTDFAGRGWYDLPAGGINTLSSTDHIAGSAHSLQVSFGQGQTTPTGWKGGRHLFTGTDGVYLRYWVKFSTNWVGSGQPYHPHEFLFLTNEDGDYVGPSSTHLTLYVEENFQSGGGSPLLQAQDAQNIDASRVNQDLTAITENRAVSGCNGNQDGTPSQCYQVGTDWVNGKGWKSAQPLFLQNPGPGYKGDWHKVEAYFRLNSIAGGLGQRDGVAQYWLDGQLVIDRHDLVFRTGLHPNMKINQLLMAPYIGDGSPVAQSLWYDDLVVMTAPPSP